MTRPLLEIDALHMRFQGIVALDDVSFSLDEGKVTALIGPNGAGKTTMFNCVTGMYRPTDGAVRFAGETITGLKAHRIARHGIARTFQNLALFSGLTVLQNLLVGAYLKGSSGLMQGMFRTGATRAEEAEAEAQAREILAYLGLEDVADAKPSQLPYGQQKRIEFGRALMQKAKLILLDEPMAGMSKTEKAAMTALIQRVRAEMGMTFLIVEHDIPVIMDVSDKIVVLDFGRKIADGDPRAVRSDPAVIAAYLGTDE